MKMMSKAWRRCAALAAGLACALVLAACGGGGSENAGQEMFGRTERTSVTSKQSGLNYAVQVYLPPGYDKRAAPLRVIYAMDGDFRFRTLVPELIALNYHDVILVSVDPISSQRRFVDFTMPGAEAFYRFLTTELIPIVESRYRIDPARRSFSGHSLSAEFGLFALYMEPPERRVFANYFIADCTCWMDANAALRPDWDVPAAMEQRMYERSRALPVTLAMSGDSKGNLERAGDVYDRIARRGYTGLRAHFSRHDLGHVPMDGPAFREALSFVFGPPVP